MADEASIPSRDQVLSSKPSKIRRKCDKRSARYSDTESEHDIKPRVKKPPVPKTEKSGYSSSDEPSSSEDPETPLDTTESTLRHRKPPSRQIHQVDDVANPPISPDEASSAVSESPQPELPAGYPIEEWELVEKYPKESDVSLTTDRESSDDFWKSDSQLPLVPKEPKSPKKRKSAKSPWFAFVRKLFAEWRDFKSEHSDALYRIRICRNNCFVSFILVFIYCGIGGIIFHTTEGAFEMFYKCGVKRVKRDFLDTLWSRSGYMREDEWKSQARNKLMEFENQLYDAYEAGMNSYSGQRGWSFLNSLVYCVTLVTTIGYGHIAPKTWQGRLITIVYSLFGVPMFLIMLADYGKLLTRWIKFLWAFVRRLYYTGSCRKVRRTAPVQEMVKGVQLVFDMTKLRRPSTVAKDGDPPAFPCPTSPTGTPAFSSYTVDDEFNLPVSVAFSILVLYMLVGSLVISEIEGWSTFESFYFVYISILTIGLGDLVLTDTVFLICLVYLIFGLALTSMCINVVQEKLSDSFRQATAKIGATMGIEVTEDLVLNVPVMNQTPEIQS